MERFLDDQGNKTAKIERDFGSAALTAAEFNLSSEQEIESAKERAKFFGNQYRKVRNEFRNEVLDTRTDLTEEEFKGWEKRTRDAFRGMTMAEAEAGIDTEKSRYIRDKLENIADTTAVERTVEVYAANFYESRNGEILEAIKASPSDYQERDLETVYSLFQRANEHVLDVENLKLKAENPEAWSRNCQFSHNQLIKNFNDINNLAVKYGATPLTCRNFVTNDFEYDDASDPGSYTLSRCVYDRNIVETYCKEAFPKLYRGTSRETSGSDKRREPSLLELFHLEGED